VSRIATAFWCQPTSRAADGQQQRTRTASPAKGESKVPAKAEQFLTSFALVLALVAAALSTPNHALEMHRMARWLMLGVAPEAAANAGAIGENPELLRGHDADLNPY
jgi:hypothetical protein